MKDPWIQSFQDRLGEYELDVPVPSATRKRPWPVFLAVGAAAAVAILLLVPGRRTILSPQPPLRLPGERQAVLLAEALPKATPLTAIYRQASPKSAFVGPETSGPEADIELEGTPVAPVNEVTDDRKEEAGNQTVIVTESITPEQDWWKTEDPATRRTAGGFSTKIHIGNAFSSLSSGQIDPSGIELFHERTEKAAQDMYFNVLNGDQQFDYSVGSVYVPQWNCRLPIKAGLSLRYQFTPVLGVETGLEYSYHYAETTDQTARLHYIGIPVKISARLVQWGRLLVYASAGEETEWMVGGQIETREKSAQSRMRVQQHPFQFSLMGATGLDFTLAPGFSLYVEPGVAWHADMKGDLPSYYREHPFSFDLRGGLRFAL